MRFEEAQFSAENDSDFLVTYSALATAFVVGNEPVPLKLSSGMDSTRPAGDTLSPVDKAGILYTDEIGEYMEVKSVKALIFSEQVFEHPIMTTNAGDGTTTYTFHGTIDSPVYGTLQASDILITVKTKTAAGTGKKTQVLTVQIPDRAIPLRVNNVELGEGENVISHTVDVAYPLRVIYTVGVQDGVKTANGAVDAGKIDESYKSRHTEGDRLHFYCNLFDGEKECVHGLTAGNAQAQFAPSASNPYYIVQEDIPLYTDNECTMAATGDSFDPDSVYYYTVQFYGAAHTITEVRSLSHTALNVEKKNGQWNIRPGQPYEPNTAARHAEKVNQQTDTAALCAYATMDDATAFAYHGNNGRLSVRAPQGSLTVSKTVAGTGARPDDAFSFTVTLSDTAVAGAYGGMTFTDGVATFPLKHGESRTASGLPAGIHYQVREAAVAGYTASSEGASGSIPQDGAAQARFVNRKDNGNGENGGGDILTPPRTGDGARPGLWLALAALALLLSWAFGRRRSAG